MSRCTTAHLLVLLTAPAIHTLAGLPPAQDVNTVSGPSEAAQAEPIETLAQATAHLRPGRSQETDKGYKNYDSMQQHNFLRGFGPVFPEHATPPEMFSFEREARTPALLVLDVLEAYEKYISPAHLQNMHQVVETFRKLNLPIYWSQWSRFGPTDGHTGALDRFKKWDDEYYNFKKLQPIVPEVAPTNKQEEENVMRVTHYDMFEQQSKKGGSLLDLELRRKDVDTLVLIGTYTELCVLHTAFAGIAKEYDVVVLSDAVDSSNKKAHESSLEIISTGVGKVMSTKQLTDYLSKYSKSIDGWIKSLV